MEAFEYLFLDIEWNQANGTTDLSGREPVQIGIIGTDEFLEKKKSFSKYVCLRDIRLLTAKTCKITHLTAKVIQEAKEESVIYNRICQSFPSYSHVVVWTMDTYEIFREGMRRTKIKMPKHNVIVLQDILNTIVINKEKQIGFETALKFADISYTASFLHYSKHDVAYLYQLYREIFYRYNDLTEKESCYMNRGSKKLHISGCRYIRKSSDRNLIMTRKSLIFQGYTPCLCCGTVENWGRLDWKAAINEKKKKENRKMLRRLPLTEKNIMHICEQFGIKCNIVMDIVFIKTSFSSWRVHIQGNKVKKVYHENYRVNRSDFFKKKKYNEGFHEQIVQSDNFYDVIQYIYYHEKNFMKVKCQKNRIEILFEKIEQERREKENK